MASSNAALPPLSELSGVVEELRRQLAAANDAQLASEVGHHHQTVLSNIMLTGQESGQVAPPEHSERTSSGVVKVAAVNSVSNSQNGTDHNTSTDPQMAQPASALDQISAGSDFVSHHNLTPFERQALAPDVHLAQSVQLGAAPPSHPEQFSPVGGGPQTAYIDINDPPVAVVPIADQSTNEDADFSFTVPATSFIDVDVGDQLTLSAALADGSVLPAWLTFDPATQTFSGTPLNEDVGSLAIRVTATDTSGAFATQDFTVTVANVNDAPVASAVIADQSTNEDAGFSFTVPLASFTDVDVGDQLSLSAALPTAPASRLAQFDAATQTFSGTPAERRCGLACIRVTATDTAGATATQDFTVTVTNINDVPVASAIIADQAINEDAGFSFTVPPGSFTDVDVGDSLSLWQALPTAARFPPGSVSIGNPDVLRHAPEWRCRRMTIQVTATDTAAPPQPRTSTYGQQYQRWPCRLGTIADQSTNEDAGFSFTVPASQLCRCRCGRPAHPVSDPGRWQRASRLAQFRSRNPDVLRHASE